MWMILLNKTYIQNIKRTLQEITSINHNIPNNCNTRAKRSNVKIKKLRKRLNIAQSKQSFIIKGRKKLYKYRQPIFNIRLFTKPYGNYSIINTKRHRAHRLFQSHNKNNTVFDCVRRWKPSETLKEVYQYYLTVYK